MLIKVKIKLHTQLKYLLRTQKTQKAKWRCCWLSGSHKLLINSGWGEDHRCSQSSWLAGGACDPDFGSYTAAVNNVNLHHHERSHVAPCWVPGVIRVPFVTSQRSACNFVWYEAVDLVTLAFFSTFDTNFFLVVVTFLWHHADFTEHFLQSAVHLFFF